MPQSLQIAHISHEEQHSGCEQALVLGPDMALANGSNISAAVTAADLQLRAAEMEQRGQDRRRHHHSQIWTKDFHGGPYRKVSRSRTSQSSMFVPSKSGVLLVQ